MSSSLFGCSKKLIKQLQYRLKLLKNKSSSIVRLLREDMAQLIQNSNEQKAFNLVVFVATLDIKLFYSFFFFFF